jgi:CheY-like chemotaxis protein
MATIVLAEDDVHIIRVVSMWLKQHRHTVLEAPNGKKALDLLRENRPDLLVTDVNMPGMDGIELAKICAAESLAKLGIVLLTSRCDQADIGDALEGCEVVFHPKPFSPSRLVKEINEMLEAKGAGAVVG